MIQETSQLAFLYDIKPTLGARQRFVLDEILKHPNITNCELSERLQIPINTVTPRVGELRKMCLVDEDVRRKCQITGRLAIAWKAVQPKILTF
jgi:predicted transcriptional regulator